MDRIHSYYKKVIDHHGKGDFLFSKLWKKIWKLVILNLAKKSSKSIKSHSKHHQKEEQAEPEVAEQKAPEPVSFKGVIVEFRKKLLEV